MLKKKKNRRNLPEEGSMIMEKINQQRKILKDERRKRKGEKKE